MQLLAEIIAFIIQAEPSIQQLIVELVGYIRDVRQGKIDAAQAEASAQAAISKLLAIDFKAETAGIDQASLDALKAKFNRH